MIESIILRNAPVDDELLTEEDHRAIAAAGEWLRHNQPIPLEEVLADFGLTMADWATLPFRKKTHSGVRHG